MMQQILLGYGASTSSNFSVTSYTGTASAQSIDVGVDLSGGDGMVLVTALDRGSGQCKKLVFDTVRGAQKAIQTDSSIYEYSFPSAISSFNNSGFAIGTSSFVNSSGNNFAAFTFGVEADYFDIQTWSGDGTTYRSISHNLGQTPKMIWVKNISTSVDWVSFVPTINNNQYITVNDTHATRSTSNLWDTHTSSVFKVGSNLFTNQSGQNYVAYLWGDVSGERKIGSYTGNGTSSNSINVGFEPQFVLIRNRTGTGNWNVFDTTRGVTSGNDQRLSINRSNNQASIENIEFNSNGFELKSSQGEINTSGSTYIYMAIAAS